MRLLWLYVLLAWAPVMWTPGASAEGASESSEQRARRKRQALNSGGCADMSLFNYLLYYYLIQAQNAHQKHTQADQMAGALLKLKQRRGTDPLPTLISTQAGQNALLAMLQNVAQNNPAQLLQLLSSIRDGGQQPLAAPPAGWPTPGFGAAAARAGFQQPVPLNNGFGPTGGSFPSLQGSSALYRPQVQQALYVPRQQQPLAAPAASPLQLPFSTGDDPKLDNSLQFSPSLRRQVYAPQPELEPTPAPPRTIIREPSTRLHVSTVTVVTTVLTSQASLVPLVFNGLQTSTEIMHTTTHVLTATQLRTLAEVVTPTVIEANGQTTTLYGGGGPPNAEIVTDLNYHDDESHVTTAGPTPTVPTGIFSTSVVAQPPATTVIIQAPGVTALPAGVTVLQPGQTIFPGGQLLVQNGITTVIAAPQQTPTPPPPPTTTTTEKPEGRLLKLLRSRAAARRRGLPLRGAALRRQQEKERRLAEQQRREEETEKAQHVSTSVSVSVSSGDQPSAAAPVQVQPASTPAPPPAPVFQPQQVPVYVEKDGVLVVAADLAPAPIFTPEATPAPSTTTTPAPVAPVVQAVLAASGGPGGVVVVAGGTPPAPVFTPKQSTTTEASTKSLANTTTTQITTTTAKPAIDFGFDFEETVYASASTSSSSSSETTEKVVTEEDFQNLLDGTFVILANSLPGTNASSSAEKAPETVEGSGAGPPSNSSVKVSVSYAVSTSVSEGR